ncbi:twitching motility protein PilT [Halarcobacter mediterraneus]|uniref:Twitching motility protein PilT n=1 Tax=Halarcobacter mediterraneus TaxID=2023153 RepID=A0A4Q1B4E1_9BACT|nr:PIN domain-containing protein [Halarcobacter mediterraneus]RXK13087.1 twitching motility protein PilT [Halarcobacter mediterraneus]
MIYIIDTNILIQYPQILSRIESREMVIPKSVMDELYMFGPKTKMPDIFKFVSSFIDNGIKIIHAPKNPTKNISELDKSNYKLSDSDIDTLYIALEESKTNVPIVVTDDLKFAKVLKKNGVKTITGKVFLDESDNETINEEVKNSANKIVSSQKKQLFISFFLGIFASILGNLIYFYLNIIISTITVWGTLVALPIVGIILFWFRENFRLSYGVFEFFAGIIMSLYVFFPLFNYSTLGPKEGLQILAGLYVMVRGLDNIGKAIIGTRIEPLWEKFF